MANEFYAPDAMALVKQDPARAVAALVTVITQELNRLRQNPTTTYPALTKEQVVSALIAAWNFELWRMA